MTATPDSPVRTRSPLETILIGGFVVLAVIVLVAVFSGRQTQLRASAVGLNGLDVWLSGQGHDVQVFTGGWTVQPDDIGLLVLPLHDTDLVRRRDVARTKEDLLVQSDEYDLSSTAARIKATQVPALVVLPKWRSGMRLTQRAHPDLLVDPRAVGETLFRATGYPVETLARAPQAFSEHAFAGSDLRAELYMAQTFAGNGCTPIIGRAGAMVLGACPLPSAADQDSVLILADPDLINNHGLRLGDNASIIAELLPDRAQDKSILLDYSTRNWFARDQAAPTRTREWSDLLRLFAPPFTLLWIGAGLTMALVLWRAGRRYGPVQDRLPGDDARSLTAIRARARLMRRTDQDGALLRDYVAARLAATRLAFFGMDRRGNLTDQAALFAYADRHAPETAAALRESLRAIAALPHHLPATSALQYVDTFEHHLEQLAHART